MNKFVALGRARQLAVQFGLDENVWDICINPNVIRRLGQCVYPRGEAKGRIELSASFIEHNELSLVEETIRHEIAHAIVGCSHAHDEVWQAKAVECGAKPRACCNDAIVPHGPWQTQCPTCKKIFSRHRRPKRLTGHYCRKCGRFAGQLPEWQFVGNNGLLNIPKVAANVPALSPTPALDIRQMIRDFIAKNTNKAVQLAYVRRIVEAYPGIAAEILWERYVGDFINELHDKD